MKGSGWRVAEQSKRKGQHTPQKARQHRKKIQMLRQKLKKQGSGFPDLLFYSDNQKPKSSSS